MPQLINNHFAKLQLGILLSNLGNCAVVPMTQRSVTWSSRTNQTSWMKGKSLNDLLYTYDNGRLFFMFTQPRFDVYSPRYLIIPT
jgi:hypothetical protein